MSAVTPRLVDDLTTLHDSYARAINEAVAADNLPLINELAAGYDTDATQLVAEREGKTHLLPLVRRGRRNAA